MKDEALKLAKAWFERNTYADEAVEVYEAIEQALAAPVQEPVAWLYKDDWGRTKIAFSKETANEWGTEVQPLYTTTHAQPAPVQSAERGEPAAYLFTNVQSGDIEASCNPDHKEGEREMWHREPLVRPPAAQRQWVEVEQIKWDGDKLIAKLKEKNT
jgi:hypothetical protein